MFNFQIIFKSRSISPVSLQTSEFVLSCHSSCLFSEEDTFVKPTVFHSLRSGHVWINRNKGFLIDRGFFKGPCFPFSLSTKRGTPRSVLKRFLVYFGEHFSGESVHVSSICLTRLGYLFSRTRVSACRI